MYNYFLLFTIKGNIYIQLYQVGYKDGLYPCKYADWVVHLTTLFFTGLTAESEGEKCRVEKLTTLAAFLAIFLGRRRNCALLYPLTTPPPQALLAEQRRGRRA